MGLEKLKSIFSNLEKFNRTDLTQFDSKFDDILSKKETIEKVGTDVTNNMEHTEKVGADVTSGEQSNLANMTPSIYSIETEPQQVDGLPDIHANGFTPNLEHKSPSQFVGGTSIYRIETEPQEVDGLLNIHANGFTPNLEHKSPSQFVGGTSIYRIETEPQEVNNILDTNALGFTANLEHKSPTQFVSPDKITFIGAVDFMGGENSYYPTLDPVIPGFTNEFNTGGYTFGVDDKGNSKYIDSDGVMIPTGTHTEYNNAGITFSNSWTYEPNFIPPDGTTWTNSGNYYDSIHTKNPISDQFGGPVNFLNNGIGFTLNQGNPEIDMVSNYLTAEGGLAATARHTVDGYIFDSDLENSVPNNLFFSDTIKIQSGVDNINSSKGSNLGGQESIQFKTLYTNSNTATDNKYLGPPQDGSGINLKDRFDIKSELWNSGNRDMSVGGGFVLAMSSFGLGNIPGLLGGNGNEPYMIRDIGNEDNPSSYFPLKTLMRDTSRISKFLGSNKGAQFVIDQNLMGSFQQYRPYYDPGSTIINTALPSEGLGMIQKNYPRDFGITGQLIDLINNANTYSEWLDTRDTAPDSTSVIDAKNFSADMTHAEREIARKPIAHQGADLLEGAADKVASSVMGALGIGGDEQKPIDAAGIKKGAGVTSKKNVNSSISGDRKPLGNNGKGDIMTILPIEIPNGDINLPTDHARAAALTHHGMPLYFKDLRDNAVIFFRAYVDGISDTISPSWESTNYVGRSEPVYTYTNAEREITFNLKLFANTKDELNMIYTKMNRLNSLCYPEYKSEVVFKNGEVDVEETKKLGSDSRVMMKPPIVKFRLGELFGSAANEMVGFIKSLSHTFPDESPWEIQNGRRVPKYIQVAFGFQVIHSEVPSLNFARTTDDIGNATIGNSFYGMNQIIGVEMEK